MENYLAQAIRSLQPTSEFSFSDDDYSTIKWDILKGVAPTKAAIDAEIARLKAAVATDALAATAAKASGIAKLAALGFTEAEIAAW